MRILSCNIYSFGSLHDYKVDFNEGLSSITEQNGFGKTTLSVFIKAMFYSMKPARKTDTHLTRERVKYYPWNGGSFGGSLDFEQNGKAYRIIRRFDKFSATQDEFSLIDLSANSECSDFSENIGEEIFGVDVDGFLRSTFSNGEATLNLTIDNTDNSLVLVKCVFKLDPSFVTLCLFARYLSLTVA